ncbi:MAG: hypothetical protein HY238_08880 [Acidobacteria bacterium]|nr:hypothetical protein [Acidobacteriota bacterium]
MTARIFDSGFAQAHDSFNGISAASDGNIYYVLSSAKADIGARMFRYDPKTDTVRQLGDLTEACGEKGSKAIVQGKSHVSFAESGGKLYFATHLGYYDVVDGQEKAGAPPPGMKPYPGGHFLSYDMASGKFEDLGLAPRHEGIITFAMDTQRRRLYGITWPGGRFLRLDLATRNLRDLGPTSEEGEAGKGATFRTICRSLTVNPDDGSAYFTTSDGVIHRYVYARDAIETVAGESLKKDYFGRYNPSTGGSMAYNWRQTFWYAPEKAIYGVHGNSGYLFRFLPATPRVEVFERITSEPSKASGMFDQFNYGYLGFALGPGGTIYYLTGGPVYEGGRRESRGRENLHLITWDISARRYRDHGPIVFPDGRRPTYVNSIAVASDGSVYALARVADDAHARSDLMRIAGPK